GNGVYKDIFDNAYSGLAVISLKDGSILLANPRGELMLREGEGGKAEGTPFFTRISEVYRERIIDELKNSDCVSYQHVRLAVNNAEIWVSLFIKRLSSSAALACFSNVDKYANRYLLNLKELEVSSFILNSLPSAFILTDISGTAVKANISAQIMLGLASKEILGRTGDELFPPQLHAAFFKEDAGILSGEIKYYSGEHSFSIRGQAEKVYHINKIPNMDACGEILGVLSVFEDITGWVSGGGELPAKGGIGIKREDEVHSFFRRNAAERKRLDRFRSARLNGMGNIFKYLAVFSESRCREIFEAAEKNSGGRLIQKCARDILNLSYFERMFKFNETPKTFSPNVLIKTSLKRLGVAACLTEDAASKDIILEGYPEELEEIFTRVMEQISEAAGEFEISLTADTLEYTAAFSFKGGDLQEMPDNDIIFLYSSLFIKEILGEIWETESAGGKNLIRVRFAV
ncbi:MAG: PAS domain-containing protein, partial [Deferribacteraceae bacterium]|nr:PAS domain-containing protein [Deferribacteraceae bacterium]